MATEETCKSLAQGPSLLADWDMRWPVHREHGGRAGGAPPMGEGIAFFMGGEKHGGKDCL